MMVADVFWGADSAKNSLSGQKWDNGWLLTIFSHFWQFFVVFSNGTTFLT